MNSHSISHIVAEVVDNVLVAPNHYVITFVSPYLAEVARPGNFVNILTADSSDPFLRKPFSVFSADTDTGHVQLLYSVVGGTTKRMAVKRAGDTLDLIGPLGGRIFEPPSERSVTHIMVGGGYGVPPLVFLAHTLLTDKPNCKIKFIVGARDADLLLCLDRLDEMGISTHTSTENGTHGIQGRVTDVLTPMIHELGHANCFVYCCGPTPMMKAVGDLCLQTGVSCQVSVEVGMPCGVGVCMACVIDLKDGRRVRCCTDGPVFDSAEVVW